MNAATFPGKTRWPYRLMNFFATVALCAVLSGCAQPGLKEERVDLPLSYAEPPAAEGVLAEVATRIMAQHGTESSGFRILDGSRESLTWRLTLMDSAVSSLDIQTYLWYPDNSGLLILERAIRASQRGVRVRLIVDDLLLHGHDQLIANLESQPNIEFRIFNPWEERGNLGARAGEIIAEMERLNSRMHDKLMIADGNAAIVGGRNIGDHYFGLSDAYNFHDTDLMGFGHIARQANAMFDSFWNSELVVSAQNLTTNPDEEIAQEQWRRIQQSNQDSPQLKAFPREPRSWNTELDALVPQLRIGTSILIYDEVSTPQIDQNMFGSMFSFFKTAKKELLINNAYVIPSQPAIDFMQELGDRGVKVRILTNSLASHDVPAVNSHYEAWRDDLIKAGVDLYEFRADAAIQSLIDVPPAKGEFTGLHSKTAVVDRRFAFVGSMNLDPRSARINTEMGAIVDSPALAEDLAQLIERDMQPENAWQVMLDEHGKPYWVNSEETVYRQPARDGLQRVMNKILKIVPKEQN